MTVPRLALAGHDHVWNVSLALVRSAPESCRRQRQLEAGAGGVTVKPRQWTGSASQLGFVAVRLRSSPSSPGGANTEGRAAVLDPGERWGCVCAQHLRLRFRLRWQEVVWLRCSSVREGKARFCVETLSWHRSEASQLSFHFPHQGRAVFTMSIFGDRFPFINSGPQEP